MTRQYWGLGLPAAIAAMLFICIATYLYATSYVVSGDDAAVIDVSVKDGMSKWFTEGYSTYFDVYPQWHFTFTNFLRPMDNALISFDHTLFLNNYEFYSLIYYISGFAAASIVYVIGIRAGLSSLVATIASSLCLVSPAFYARINFLNIACMFDVVCSVFILAAFLSLISGRFLVTTLFLTLGVLTKETALPAVLAASLSVYLWRGRLHTTLLLLTPLLVWGSLRLAAFGSMTGGVYALMGNDLIKVAKGISYWPLGVIHEPPGSITAFFILNVLINCSLLWMLSWTGIGLLYRATQSRTPFMDERARIRSAAILWLGSCLAYTVLLGLPPRFGAIVYPLLYLFLAMELFSEPPSQNRASRRRHQLWTGAAWVLVAGCAVNLVTETRSVFLSDPLQQEAARSFVNVLRSVPQQGETIYVINAPDEFTSPHRLASFYDLNVDLVYIDQVRGCAQSSRIVGNGITRIENGIDIALPDCADFAFSGADPAIMNRVVASDENRQGVGIYRFPDGHAGVSRWSHRPDPEFGRKLVFTRTGQPGIMLAYNWNTAHYEIVSP